MLELHLHRDVGSIDDEGLTTGNALSVDAPLVSQLTHSPIR